MSLQEYSLGFMFDAVEDVILIRKTKPSWQAGLLNGVGGKLEPGETIHDCMVREWLEETGTPHEDWDHYAQIKGKDSHVHMFRTFVNVLPTMPLHNDNGEGIEIWNVRDLKGWAKGQSVYTLSWMIDLALARHITIEAGLGRAA